MVSIYPVTGLRRSIGSLYLFSIAAAFGIVSSALGNAPSEELRQSVGVETSLQAEDLRSELGTIESIQLFVHPPVLDDEELAQEVRTLASEQLRILSVGPTSEKSPRLEVRFSFHRTGWVTREGFDYSTAKTVAQHHGVVLTARLVREDEELVEIEIANGPFLGKERELSSTSPSLRLSAWHATNRLLTQLAELGLKEAEVLDLLLDLPLMKKKQDRCLSRRKLGDSVSCEERYLPEMEQGKLSWSVIGDWGFESFGDGAAERVLERMAGLSDTDFLAWDSYIAALGFIGTRRCVDKLKGIALQSRTQCPDAVFALMSIGSDAAREAVLEIVELPSAAWEPESARDACLAFLELEEAFRRWGSEWLARYEELEGRE